MRLNPFAPNDNPMDQVLFCFGSGEDENDDDDVYSYDKDEAADFADRVTQEARDTRSRGDDTDELEDFYSAASGADIMSAIDRSTQLGPSPNVGGGGDNEQSRADRINQFGVNRRKVSTVDPEVSPSVFDPATNVYNQIRAFTPDLSVAPSPRMNPITGNQTLADSVFDITQGDLLDYTSPNPGGSGATSTPAAQVIEQARSPGSPNDVKNREREELERAQIGPSAMTMQNVGPAGPNEAYVSPAIRGEIIKQAQQPPRDEGITALLKPGGIVKNLIEDVTNRNAAFAREVTRPGNQFQRGPDGEITGVYNPRTNSVYTPESVGIFDLEAQEAAAGDLYDIQRAERDSRRESGGGGSDQQDARAAARAAEEARLAALRANGCPEGYQFNEETQSCEYVGVAKPVDVGPFDPITQNIQYTGIAGLNPFVLQPSYTTPTSFSPLFNVG